MTPGMRLSEIKAKYDAATKADLERAFSLGHQFGIERAADIVDQCNQESAYAAIFAAPRIRALKVVDVRPMKTLNWDFIG